MSVHIIIGKNFGDEGKGLATDFFALQSQQKSKSCVVIRHNGGAQAGHTVDLPEKRFVFHQLSSGSFRNADTYWSSTFLPDLYKLQEEIADFSKHHNRTPNIYAHPLCRCVYIDDIIINMALETSRGNNRHGSCGMGINESVERSKNSEFCLYLGQIREMTVFQLYEKLLMIRKKYVPKRLAELGLSLTLMGEYAELINDPQVIMNAAAEMHAAARLVNISDESVILKYDDIIFEGAQGLLLDEDNTQYAPHLTTSKTGLNNPLDIINKKLPATKPEVVYVTRSYVTRHGAGFLPYENKWVNLGIITNDITNKSNPWQGNLRFAPHGTIKEFFNAIKDDVKIYNKTYTTSLFITHLNETDDKVITVTDSIIPKEFLYNSYHPIDTLYLSQTPFSEDVRSIIKMEE